MEVLLKYVDIVDFILSAIHVSRGLPSVLVPVVLWSVWKTKVINSTALMTVMLTTNSA